MDYTSLITSEHAEKPLFKALVSLLTSAINQNTQLMASMPSLFDVYTAVGQQLDFCGQWIGMSRDLNPAITNVFFSWGTEGLGYSQGYWRGIGASNGITVLPDAEYRSILLAQIVLNQWDGDIPDALAALQLALPNNSFFIQDNQNMTMILGIQGTITPLTQALVTRGYFNIRPAGVQLTTETTTIFFGWGMNTTDVQGWTLGSWGNILPSS